MTSNKILVIEDNTANMKLVNDILTANGYEVLQATEGLTGLDVMKSHANEISLILLDLKLPDINGIEVIKKAKADVKTKNLPIIVISAHAMEADIKSSKEAGCVDYLTKPLNISKFLAKVKSYI